MQRTVSRLWSATSLAVFAAGAFLAISSSSPAAATQVKPDSKTVVKCAKSTPCFSGENSAFGDGVYGVTQGTNTNYQLPGAGGVLGVAAAGYDTGVIGIGYAELSAGVFGEAASGYAGLFQGASSLPAMVIENGSYGDVLDLFGDAGALTIDRATDVVTDGYVEATQFITSSKVRFGERLGEFGARSTRATLEDTGTARLNAGEATVRFDAAFESAIDASRGYQVFLTPDGDTRGLYIAAKYEGGFVVRETEHGRSSLFFDYRVVAHPYDATDERLPRLALHAPTRPRVAMPPLPRL